jgi:seryl-tRNA(Sec) selenium transferase
MATYQELGVRPFINASGTITTLGGSLMPSEVLRAMQEAATRTDAICYRGDAGW